MNNQHLEQLIHDLQNLPDKQFNMENGNIYLEETFTPFSNQIVPPLCGCIGAWVNYWYYENASLSTLALQDFLEITPEEAEYLFLGLFDDDDDLSLNEIKKETAIKYLQECSLAGKIIVDSEYLGAIEK
jgi:hypothetical protein